MSEDYLKDPQHMLATIRAYASYFMALTGKTGFDDRVLKAMGRVPADSPVPGCLTKQNGIAVAPAPDRRER